MAERHAPDRLFTRACTEHLVQNLRPVELDIGPADA
jgi:hypothetical protein